MKRSHRWTRSMLIYRLAQLTKFQKEPIARDLFKKNALTHFVLYNEFKTCSLHRPVGSRGTYIVTITFLELVFH